MDGTPIVTDISLLAKLMNLVPFFIGFVVIVVAALATIWLVDLLFLPKQDLRDELRAKNLAWAIVLATFIFSVFYLGGQALGAPTDAYDQHFRKATKLYWSTALDWHWAKAQGMQESGLRVNVCSPVGACGLMQFMPGTAKQFGIDPFNARASIYAWGKYQRWLWNNWSAPRPALDRYYFSLASYNWGIGSVLRAQKAASGANLWEQIVSFLPRETAEYAPRIHRWCNRFTRSRCSIG